MPTALKKASCSFDATRVPDEDGEIIFPVNDHTFNIYDDLTVYPAFSGHPEWPLPRVVRELSGTYYAMLPWGSFGLSSPHRWSFFINWDSEIVRTDVYGDRRVENQVGSCDFKDDLQDERPNVHVPLPANWGISDGGNRIPMPQGIPFPSAPYTAPLLVSRPDTEACVNEADGSQEAFQSCMIHHMGDDRTQALLKCIEDKHEEAGEPAHSGNVAKAFCMMGVTGDANTKKAAAVAQRCYERYGDDWHSYPLCTAQGMTGGETQRVIGCVQDQMDATKTGGDFSYVGVAVCYGGSLLNLNREDQIAIECGIASGGVPPTWAACAGGRLTVIELDRCWQDGVGGDNGCFGPNNFFVKTLKQFGIDAEGVLGAANAAVTFYRNAVSDLTNGPGAGNDIYKVRDAARQLGNRMSDAGSDIASKFIPGFKHF